MGSPSFAPNADIQLRWLSLPAGSSPWDIIRWDGSKYVTFGMSASPALLTTNGMAYSWLTGVDDSVLTYSGDFNWTPGESATTEVSQITAATSTGFIYTPHTFTHDTGVLTDLSSGLPVEIDILPEGTADWDIMRWSAVSSEYVTFAMSTSPALLTTNGTAYSWLAGVNDSVLTYSGGFDWTHGETAAQTVTRITSLTSTSITYYNDTLNFDTGVMTSRTVGSEQYKSFKH